MTHKSYESGNPHVTHFQQFGVFWLESMLLTHLNFDVSFLATKKSNATVLQTYNAISVNRNFGFGYYCYGDWILIKPFQLLCAEHIVYVQWLEIFSIPHGNTGVVEVAPRTNPCFIYIMPLLKKRGGGDLRRTLDTCVLVTPGHWIWST